MSRLLFFAAIAVIVYWLFQSYRKRPPEGGGVSAEAEDMVRCAQCGVHLPKRESIVAEGRHFCCEAHRAEHVGKS